MVEDIGRRNFIKLALGSVIALWAASRGIPVEARGAISGDRVMGTQVDRELELALQESYESREVFEVNQIDKFAETWDLAVKRSLELNEMVTIKLSAGEHVTQARLNLKIPKGAKIAWMGETKRDGSTLLAGREIADGVRRAKEGSKELYWVGSKHNLVKIVIDEGASFVMRDLKLDGGCSEAGVGGYEAPPGPWNSVVRILGSGLGMDMEPIAYMEGLKRGLVVIKNVQAKKSISAGVLVQNVRGFWGENNYVEFADAGIVANWCDRAVIKDCSAERCLSDGFYVNDNVSAEIFDCSADKCRQGLDIQGGEDVKVDGFESGDCAIGYRIGQSESDQRPLGNLLMKGANSDGCAVVYSIGKARGIVKDAIHTDLGRWKVGYDRGDFSHAGIVRPQDILGINGAVWYEKNVAKPAQENIRGTKSLRAPDGYNDSLVWPTF